MITDLANLVLPLLREWVKKYKGKWPENVLYYRDGVATSQYDEVMQEELPDVRKAFAKLAEELGKETVPSFKLTAVVVTKRHSTRFFPINKANAMDYNGNTRPGTLVDSIVTSPYYTDFYLQSHNGIKGTARPAHYFVLKNEMAMTTQQLQDLVSNQLILHRYIH
jgi:eukaryotic translation initiation factor 2C